MMMIVYTTQSSVQMFLFYQKDTIHYSVIITGISISICCFFLNILHADFYLVWIITSVGRGRGEWYEIVVQLVLARFSCEYFFCHQTSTKHKWLKALYDCLKNIPTLYLMFLKRRHISPHVNCYQQQNVFVT